MAGAISGELDTLFSPGVKHVQQRKEWVAVAKKDDRESGAGGQGPIDLETGVVELPHTELPHHYSEEAGTSESRQ